MSQAPQPAPAPGARAPPAATRRQASASEPGGRSRRASRTCPSLLNRWQVAAVAVCLVFGVVSALLQFLGWQANGQAADNTEQLVRVQEIQSSLLRADALATNAFLVGGLEAPEQRAEYDEALDDVLRGITDAAEAQPADREALAALNSEVATYASAIAQARDNNRQGFPIGAEYLLQAGVDLRAASSTADPRRAGQPPTPSAPRTRCPGSTRSGSSGSASLALVGAVVAQPSDRATLPPHGSTSGWRSRRSRSRCSPSSRPSWPRTSRATTTSWSTAATSRRPTPPRSGPLANDAKANESLRLIKRGSGPAYEDALESRPRNRSSDQATGIDARAVAATTPRCTARSSTLDDGGNWLAAVGKATTRDDAGASAALDSVDRLAPGPGRPGRRRRPPTTLRSGRGFAIGLAAADAAARPGRGGALRLGHQPATQGVRMRRLVRRGRRVASLLLAGCGGYDDTAVPEPAGEPASRRCRRRAEPRRLRRPDPRPTSRAARSTTSAAAPVERDPASAAGWSSASRPTRSCSGSNNPLTGQIEGFDIDLVKAIAEAIFGDGLGTRRSCG